MKEPKVPHPQAWQLQQLIDDVCREAAKLHFHTSLARGQRLARCERTKSDMRRIAGRAARLGRSAGKLHRYITNELGPLP